MINDGDSEEQRSRNGPSFASLWSFYIIIVHPEYVIEPCMEPIIQIKETTNRLKKQTISCFLFVHVWFDWVLWKIDLFAISVVKHSIQLNSIFLGILGCLWRGHPCRGQLGAYHVWKCWNLYTMLLKGINIWTSNHRMDGSKCLWVIWESFPHWVRSMAATPYPCVI